MQLNKFLLPVILISVMYNSCKEKTGKELVINKWKIIKMSGGMVAKMSDTVIAAMIKNNFLQFDADGSYHLQTLDTITHGGVYKLSDDERYLIITPDATKRTDTNTVNEITTSSLIFTDPVGTRLEAVPGKK